MPTEWKRKSWAAPRGWPVFDADGKRVPEPESELQPEEPEDHAPAPSSDPTVWSDG